MNTNNVHRIHSNFFAIHKPFDSFGFLLGGSSEFALLDGVSSSSMSIKEFEEVGEGLRPRR